MKRQNKPFNEEAFYLEHHFRIVLKAMRDKDPRFIHEVVKIEKKLMNEYGYTGKEIERIIAKVF